MSWYSAVKLSNLNGAMSAEARARLELVGVETSAVAVICVTFTLLVVGRLLDAKSFLSVAPCQPL